MLFFNCHLPTPMARLVGVWFEKIDTIYHIIFTVLLFLVFCSGWLSLDIYHILHDYDADIEVILRLFYSKWHNADEYAKIRLGIGNIIATKKHFIIICRFLHPWYQGSLGQHGDHLGPIGPRWSPCWPYGLCYLGHWGRDKTEAISRTTFSNAFSWMKMYGFRLRFRWSLFLWFKLIIFQHWFR